MNKPILFNTEMVQATLDGRKTVTRRVVKPQPIVCKINTNGVDYGVLYDENCNAIAKSCYSVGDILWVRETFYQYGEWFDVENRVSEEQCIVKKQFIPCGNKPIYFMDTLPTNVKVKKGFKSGRGYYKRPSLFMPRWATRIFLKVTDVRVERLHNITIDGVKMEGIPLVYPIVKMIDSIHLKNFIKLWDSTIKKQDFDKYSWNANPWVWVYEFERVEHFENNEK